MSLEKTDDPADPKAGDLFIIGDSPSGKFAGKTPGDIAFFPVDGGSPITKTPSIGDVVDDKVFTSSGWVTKQMPFLADAKAGSEATTLNALLALLQAHGLMAPGP